MKQKIVSVALNEEEYQKFLELKEYYILELNEFYNDAFQLSNSEVFKVAMLTTLEKKKGII